MELATEDRECIRGILQAQAQAGSERPLLALDVDVDGDGIVDAWGLDEAGEVVLVSGVNLADTDYVSEGDDVGPEWGNA